jgi:succinate dehydrogenase hydrophobic anchor subunit
MWAEVIFAIAVSHIIAGVLTSSQDLAGSHPANLVLNWVIPIVLIVFAIKRTRAIADERPAGAANPTNPTAQ